MFGMTSQAESQPTENKTPKNPRNLSRFRRRLQKTSQKADDRNEAEGNEREPSTRETTVSARSSSGSFFGGDKRQKKVVYRDFSENALKELEIVTEDIPEPASETDVVLKVSASTVSYNDCLIRSGFSFNLINPTSLPATPGSDVVGNIIKLGKKARQFQVGDRVACLVRTGGNARYISVPQEDLVEVPRSCDSAEAACMVSTYSSAYQALRIVTNDEFTLNDKTILVTGGIEPIGQALIQLCARAGAQEIYATAPVHRHRYVKSVLGAKPLPMQPDEWLETTKGSMDIVFDITCHDVQESPRASLKSDGVVVSIGMSALMRKEKQGVFGAPISAYWEKLKGQLLPNTKSYEVWKSFNDDKDAFKVRILGWFRLNPRSSNISFSCFASTVGLGNSFSSFEKELHQASYCKKNSSA